MQAYKEWKHIFNAEHIKEHYYKKIYYHPSIGLDKTTPKKFDEDLLDNIDIIIKKVHNGTYNFTRYKQLLFLKSVDKPPRSISVPTMRDKLTISLLNEFLNNVYGKEICCSQMPQIIINDIMENISQYTHFIKLDIKTFFASIDQILLINIIKKKIRKKEAISLITKAIQTPSLSYPVKNRTNILSKTKGIPEGLSISNSLANIFLSDIDSKYKACKEISYWRYVDDILIFLNEKNYDEIKRSIKSDIRDKKLTTNEKEDEGKIEDGFTYLGYLISKNKVSVRESTVLKMEQSLEYLFKSIDLKKVAYVQWKLNLKITGFIVNNHKYGWMFFFSQITDISLLYHLDNLVKKFLVRYKLNNQIKVKRFVRAYHEISKALHKTKYIPNLDQMSIDKKKEILMQIYGKNIEKLDNKNILLEFNKIIVKEIQDIEKDVQDFS